MNKKENPKRGYMTPEEVREHLERDSALIKRELRKYSSPEKFKQEPYYSSRYYGLLKRIFANKHGLLSKKTKDSIKTVMGEQAIYNLFKEKKTDRHGTDITGKSLKSLANQVKFLHDIHKPDYVFLTESSAVPVGYTLKEAWKTAYPGEKPPVFYRIVPGGSKEFFEKRIKNKNSKIFVYDEYVDHGRTLMLVGEALKKAGYNNVVLGKSGSYGFSSYCSIDGSSNFDNPDHFFLKELNWKLRNKIENAKTKKKTKELEKKSEEYFNIVNSANFGDLYDMRMLGKVTQKKTDSFREHITGGETGLITGDTATVNAYKAVGRYVGDYILNEKRIDRKKERRVVGDLEKAVSIVAIASLLGSLFFIASNFTGNVIGNLNSNSTSAIGIILFLVGLIGTFFYFRRKK